jgi:hypothetical protein
MLMWPRTGLTALFPLLYAYVCSTGGLQFALQ